MNLEKAHPLNNETSKNLASRILKLVLFSFSNLRFKRIVFLFFLFQYMTTSE